MRIWGIAGALALMAQPASAAALEPREPSGRWVVDFGESQCVASLAYGEGEEKDYLTFKPVPTGTDVQIAMIVDGKSKRVDVDEYPLRINGVDQRAQLLRYGTSGKKVYRYLVNMPVRELAAIERIEIDVPRQNFDLVVPKMGDIATVLGECMDSLRTYWNVGTDTVTEPAQGDVRSVFSSDDYPAEAFRANESGVARAYLLVDEKGKVADCTLSAFVGNVILAAQSCAVIMDRAQFTPARDKDGNAVRTSFHTPSIAWVMPSSRVTLSELNAELSKLQDANANCLDF
ncbi:energy transducer TonB [Sphingomicrobium flavum]|uniref:energy transducer TonB n=1 Tax=Sphingomicrobium flavum TaxID=1229164 RepID=UPI0021AE202C|nr:energy transducer TonB [Sphingomicrobium flavum]